MRNAGETQESRRETLAWVSAALATPYVTAIPEPGFAQEAGSLWKDVPAQPVSAPGELSPT